MAATGPTTPVAGDEPAKGNQQVALMESLVTRQTLLTPDSFPGSRWVFYPGKMDSRLEETWTLSTPKSSEDPVLICRGEPHGYLRTANIYQDFEFGLEWKYPSDENGNSGVLLFTSGEDRIWPTSVQVQLHQPNTGCIFGSGGARVEKELEARNLSRPVNQWNELVITCRQGAVRLQVNGKYVGEAKVLTPSFGAIGLQSEGSEVHFRRIWIRDLHPIAQTAEANDAMSCCDPRCHPFDPETAPFAPAFGSPPTYLGEWGWNGTTAPGLSQWMPYIRGPQHVANGKPLAGRRDLLHTGRGLTRARGSAGEREVGGGRRTVRVTRIGRHRR